MERAVYEWCRALLAWIEPDMPQSPAHAELMGGIMAAWIGPLSPWDD